MVIFNAPGEVRLGSPETEPGHESDEGIYTLNVDWSFAVSAMEITQEQFLSVCPDYEKDYLNEHATRPDCPVNAVDWIQAARFCRLLSERDGMQDAELVIPPADGLPSGTFEGFRARGGYRLPLEAEWEIACRAGTATPRFFGYAADLLPLYSCYIDNSKGQSWEVGSGLPNPAGLFDVLGNVSEWCYDSYLASPDPNMILRAPATSPFARYAGRGNEYTANSRMVRAANRHASRRDQSSYSRGFRIAHTIRQEQAHE
jgi:formylglycine-generating enzyme required for sulfatase activity